MKTIILVLPYPISANRYWRPVKLAKHITIVPTKEAKEYKATVQAAVRAAGVTKPIEGRYQLDIRLYPNRPLDWQKRQRKLGAAWDDSVMCIDLGNAEKVLSDALNGCAIVDDKLARRIVSERMEPDEHGARVVVRVMALHIEQPQLELENVK